DPRFWRRGVADAGFPAAYRDDVPAPLPRVERPEDFDWGKNGASFDYFLTLGEPAGAFAGRAELELVAQRGAWRPWPPRGRWHGWVAVRGAPPPARARRAHRRGPRAPRSVVRPPHRPRPGDRRAGRRARRAPGGRRRARRGAGTRTAAAGRGHAAPVHPPRP